MANPALERPHSAPGQFAGTIHFRGEFAYLEDDSGHCDWNLLQFDNPYTGVVNQAVAATTASELRGSYKESDQVVFHGVLADESFGVVGFCVLFIC